MVLPKLKRQLNAKNTLSDQDSIHGHRNLNYTERSVIARYRNFNAPKICKITVLCMRDPRPHWMKCRKQTKIFILKPEMRTMNSFKDFHDNFETRTLCSCTPGDMCSSLLIFHNNFLSRTTPKVGNCMHQETFVWALKKKEEEEAEEEQFRSSEKMSFAFFFFWNFHWNPRRWPPYRKNSTKCNLVNQRT